MEILHSSSPIKEKLRLIPLGDLHLGARACDERRLDALIRWILAREDVYVVGMGDYVDGILRQDLKRFTGTVAKDELLDILDSMLNAQRNMLIKKLAPLADAGRILGLGEGNHEAELKNRHSYDLLSDVCSSLGVPNLGYSWFYVWNVIQKSTGASRDVVIYGHHGYGGGRKMGASANKREDLMGRYEADIYLMGHDHRKWGTRVVKLGATKRMRGSPPKITHRPKVIAATGTFLKTSIHGDTTYAEKFGYPPTDIGVVKITITMSGKNHELDIHVSE